METRSQMWLYKSVSSSLHGCSSTQKTHKNRIYNIHMYKYIMYTHAETYSQEKEKINCDRKVQWTVSFLWILADSGAAATLPAVVTGRVASCYSWNFSLLTICSVINKPHVRFLATLPVMIRKKKRKNLPNWPFKRRSLLCLSSFVGERRNKWFNSSSGGGALLFRTAPSRNDFTVQWQFVFVCFFVKTNVYIKKMHPPVPFLSVQEQVTNYSEWLFISRGNCKQEHKSVTFFTPDV